MGTIIISGVMCVVGLILGLTVKESENGIYFSANYPINGGNIFTVGKTTTTITDIDLTTFNDTQSLILISKIKQLTSTSGLAVKLRNMVKESDGPFAKIPVNINLHFTSDAKVKACKNTPIFSNPLVAYELDTSPGPAINIKGIMSFRPMWEQQQLSNCALSSNNTYDIWINKSHVEKWLGPLDPQLTNLSVKANIVASSI